jgi:hypothetical protein
METINASNLQALFPFPFFPILEKAALLEEAGARKLYSFWA